MNRIVKLRVPTNPQQTWLTVAKGSQIVGFSADRNDPGVLIEVPVGERAQEKLDIQVVELGREYPETYGFIGFFVVGHKSFVVIAAKTVQGESL